MKHGILLVLSLSVIALSALLPSLSGCGSKDVATGEHPGPLEIIVVDDASGEPVADLRVAVTTASGEPWSLETTGADGRVAWERGVRGEVTVLAMDTLGRYVETRIEGAGSGQHEFRIQRGSVLRFTVESADGRAIAPAITLWSPDQPRGRHVPAAGAAAAQTVTLSPVAPGQAKLLVTADGYVAQALDVLVGRGETDLGRVVLAPGGLAVEGRVSDSLEPRPTIAYFRFRGAGLSVPIDASGRFQFRGLPPTSGTLVFRRDGRELFARSVDIGDSDVDLGVVAPRR